MNSGRMRTVDSARMMGLVLPHPKQIKSSDNSDDWAQRKIKIAKRTSFGRDRIPSFGRDRILIKVYT